MKVEEFMSLAPVSCAPDSNLAQVGSLLWEHDCGALPVVRDGRVVGVVTDRDIAMAAALKARPVHEIRVEEIIAGQVLRTITEKDEVLTALELMALEKVRRLPVVDLGNRLLGMLSINDLILATGRTSRRAGPAPSESDVLDALREICEHRRPSPARPDAKRARVLVKK